MSAPSSAYPDPRTAVEDYTDIREGDLLRYAPLNGRSQSDHDFLVSHIDTEPRDRVEGTPLLPGFHRLHVVAVRPPDASARTLTIGDASAEYDTTRIINADDTLLRADRRAVRALADYIDSLDATERASL